ncbi:MAG TPA: hypothetical protein VFT96_13235 [Gemmatimonadaceae bacterium]|nr:hypothetical protein [Gemmatimonadaceae bacterium]
MIRHSSFRLLALVAGVAAIISCDAGTPAGLGKYTETPGSSGGGGATTQGDGRYPIMSIVAPDSGDTVNIGDSILVALNVRDNLSGIRSIAFAGLTYKGDPNVGTQTITERFITVTENFPAGFAVGGDTTIRRILWPVSAADTMPDSVVVRAIVIDHSGLVDTVMRTVQLVNGPSVQILTPRPDAILRPGTQVKIRARAADDDRVTKLTIEVKGDPSWVPSIDAVFTDTLYASPLDTTVEKSITLPSDSTLTGSITITARATNGRDVTGEATPVVLSIRTEPAAAPLVWQEVPPRAELRDTLVIHANAANGIDRVGFIVRPRSALDTTTPDTTTFTVLNAPTTYDEPHLMALQPKWQGKTVLVTSFAIDRKGLIGYSTDETSTTPVEQFSSATSDSMLVVYGTTYGLPRNGVVGDIAVDPTLRRVFLSNTAYNLLEVWQADVKAFSGNGVAVGAQPWGMTPAANDPGELLVANSGGTNISRVRIDNADAGSIVETGRILTRNTIAYTVRQSRDTVSGRLSIVKQGPISYSDRPQYIAQSAEGRIYYSTRPTTTAPTGTLRYLDPRDSVPDSRQVWRYGKTEARGEFAVLNVDFLEVIPSSVSWMSDSLRVCDHATGSRAAPICVGTRMGIEAAMDSLRAKLGDRLDVDLVPELSIGSLVLTDTTFVAWSADRSWIAFAEGNTNGAARVMLANDSVGTGAWRNIFFSSPIDVADLVDNAGEKVFGLALDSAGRALAVHGADSYFGAVENPFHLRMQGQFDSFNVGAGVAYHPNANVDPALAGGSDSTRLVFVASEDGTIEIIDAYYFRSRGRLAIRNKLYGPLRAALPFTQAERDAGVVVKLFGLTDKGLVVLDVTGRDIKPIQ